MIKKIKKFIFKCIFFVPDYILEIWLFEVRSWVGRTFTGKLKLDKSKVNLINLGCGYHILPDFINIDFFFDPYIDFGADLRYPLRIDSNSIDGITSEHTMEHLTYKQNDKLFKECYRILKPSSTLRIVVPDISIFIENYANKNQLWFKKWEELMFITSTNAERAKRRIATPMEAISFVTQEHLHVACWDFETMKYYLEKNGFRDVKRVAFKQGRQQNLLVDRDEESRIYVSLYLEAIK